MVQDFSPKLTEGLSSESGSEMDLVSRSLAGDQDAFGILIAQNQARLFHVLFRLLRDTEDAQDILQEAFLNAFLNLGKFQGHSKFSTWIYRIAVNAAISHKRKRKPVGGQWDGGGKDNLHEVLASKCKPSDAPHFQMETAEKRNEVLTTLNTLSIEHRSVLILKHLDNLKYETIAEILNVPIGTVRSRLNRARAELRQRLSNSEDLGKGLEAKQ